MSRHSPPSNRPHPRTIDEIASQWVARTDAGLAPAEQADLETWLAQDPVHREAFARWQDSWTRLDRPYEAGLASTLKAELMAEARARRRLVGRTAGVVGLLLVVAWQWTANFRPQTEADATVATEAVVLTPTVQSLPDGSLAELKAGSKLQVQFTTGERRIVLERGDAHFVVRSDPTRPFVVYANGVQVRAVGTAFTVALQDQAVAVVVTHGRVAVSPGGSAAEPAPEREVDAGSAVVVSTETRSFLSAPVAQLSSAATEDALAWRSPRVELTNSTLAAAVDLINHHARNAGRPRFRIADPALNSVRVSGVFRLDRPDAFIELLEAGFGVVAETRAGEVHLRSKP